MAFERVSSEHGVAAGRDIRARDIIIKYGLTEAEVRALMRELQADDSAAVQKVAELSKRLGVTESALKYFFQILGEKATPAENLLERLVDIAERYKELDRKLSAFTSEDPAIVALRNEARAALEARTETLLKEAKEKDIEAAKTLRATINKRLLSAAESAAELGALKYTELAYAEAAECYREAAKLVPQGEELVRAEYLSREGLRWTDAGCYDVAQEPSERALSIREDIFGKTVS
jgi:tetratricopeptide (TPR) repeat protein